VCGTNPVTEFRSWCGALLLAVFAGPSLCLDCDTAVQWRYSPLSFTTGAANFTTVSGALVRDADFTDKWIIDLLSDKAPPEPNHARLLLNLLLTSGR